MVSLRGGERARLPASTGPSEVTLTPTREGALGWGLGIES